VTRSSRRTLLFTPATDRRKVEKAAALGADAVILDLEDSVALARKAEARELAALALAEIDFGASERLVRINPARSGLAEADLEVVGRAPRPPDGFVVPKVGGAEDIAIVSRLLAKIELGRGLAAGHFDIFGIIETARGVVRLAEIAASDPRLEALIFGAEDLCGDIGARRTREGREVVFARTAVVIHCAAEGLQAIDTPYVDLEDEAGLVAEAREARDLGYSGKLAIHPRQVAPIAAVFTPTRAEAEAAERLLREHDRHQLEGRGAFALDGKMVDMPMVRAAERVIARARAAGILPTAAAGA